MLPSCMLLFFVLVVDAECQHSTPIRTQCRVTCNTNPSHPRTDTQLWSERQLQFRSSPSSRYSVYGPLNAYWRQYGSNVQEANHSTVTINTYQQSGSRSAAASRQQHTLGQHSSQWHDLTRHSGKRQETAPAYSTSSTQQINSHHDQQSQARRPNTHATSVTAPPLIESSTGFTHYSTLERHGQRRREGNGQGRHSGIPSRGRGGRQQGTASRSRGKGYPGRKSQSVPGEGFGEAYLHWSEYGIGETLFA